jgi:uncharacterized membrane protein YccC
MSSDPQGKSRLRRALVTVNADGRVWRWQVAVVTGVLIFVVLSFVDRFQIRPTSLPRYLFDGLVASGCSIAAVLAVTLWRARRSP